MAVVHISTKSGVSSIYQLNTFIGSGKSHIKVYKAHNEDQSQCIALKIFMKFKKNELSPHYAREEQMIKVINHQHILNYYESHHHAILSEHRASPKEISVIAMEYLGHGDLLGMISKQKLSEKLARTLFLQILSAVEFLHEQGIAHLDIKPENFLIFEEGLKLIDFDFSHRFDDRFDEGLYGTPGYRAPELITRQHADLRLADIYSLGVVLFSMVLGWAPYEELEVKRNEFVFDKFYQTLRTDPDLFWSTHNGFLEQESKRPLSENFKNLISSMLEEESSKRPKLDEIRKCEWIQGEVLTSEELKTEMIRYLDLKI